MRVRGKALCFLVVFSLSFICVAFAVLGNDYEDTTVEPDQNHLTIFECKPIANNCEVCLALNYQYGCDWCENSNQCEMDTECDKSSELALDYGDLCPNSSIINFTPTSGLYEGGTNVTIQSDELDCPFNVTEDSITVADTSCEPINDSCVPNKSIICRMDVAFPMPHANFTQGPVRLTIRNSVFESETNYTIVNPKIYNFSPLEGPRTGGTELTIQGEYLNAGNNVEVFINDLPCVVFLKNPTTLKCVTIATKWQIRGHVTVKFDGISRIFDKYFYQYTSVKNLPPEYSNDFVPQGTPQGGNRISVYGEHLELISNAQIQVGSQLDEKNQKIFSGECNVHNDSLMTCVSPPIPDVKNCSFDFNTVEFPMLLHYRFIATMLNDTQEPVLNLKYPRFFLYCIPTYDPSSVNKPKQVYLSIVLAVVIILLFVISILLLYKRWTRTRSKKAMKKMRGELDRLELRVAAECKEAFAELQTEICDPRISRIPDCLPFWDYRTYVMKILFPNIQDHSIILGDKPKLISKEKQLQSFHRLISNKRFLIQFIRTLESVETFSMNDRVYFASMLMISLQNEMEYCTDIIKTLLESMIENHLRSSSHPKLLLRGTESIVEKMLSTWLSCLLYEFLQKCAGIPLFILYKGIKQQVNKGPIDEITSEARYSLNERKLIRQHVEYCPLTVHISVSQDTACSTGLESAVENIPIKMLDCDTISQAKEKAVDGIYFAVNYSKRPKPSELDLILLSDSSDSQILCDIDSSSEIEGERRRRNTLHHYRITNGSKLHLESVKQASNPNQSNPERHQSSCETLKSTIIECTAPLISSSDAYYKEWHLVKPNRRDDHRACKNGAIMPEVYLTRLLSTKGTLQKFVNDLFEVILSSTRQSSCFPIAIKYLFDFLDNQAAQHAITDPEVVHAWKNNCLPLRFWVNVIQNPDFLFDIHKSNIIYSCLSVIAQTFMDSCSIGDHRLTKDSPTSKLLYAKDIPFYRKWVKKYYADIKAMPPVSLENMSAVLAKESQLHCKDFNINAAVYELYKYAVKYKDRLIPALRADESSQKFGLVEKLEQILETVTNDSNLV